jgi:CelD/BcsL family acetyltransferase involved in cellulose biosynthesis
MNLTAQIVTAPELTSEDILCWERLQQHSMLQSPFFSPHYVQAVAACRDGVRVARLVRDGRTVGFFPFQYASEFHRLIGSAERVGEEMTDYFGVVAERDFRIDPTELMALCGLSGLYFTHLDESQSEFGLSGESPAKGLMIDLPEGGEVYWSGMKTRDRKFVNDTHRKLRKIEQTLGPLRFTFHTDSIPEELDRLIRSKRAQYMRTLGQDLFAEEWRRRLLERLASLSEPGCGGVLSVLHAGDHWVASHFGLIGSGILHRWFPVYDPAYNSLSPGRLLLYHQIMAAQEHGVTRIDSGAGDSSYKRDFANYEHFYYRGLWLGRGVRPYLTRAALALKWRLNRGAGEGSGAAS